MNVQIQKKRLNLLWPFIISIIVGYVFALYIRFAYDSPFPNYSEYYQPLITAIGIILALILVVTMFYLGKFHDYYRESVKYQGMMEESFSICKDSFENMLITTKGFENSLKSLDEKESVPQDVKDVLNHVIETEKTTQKKFSGIEQSLEKIKEEEKEMSTYTKKTIIDFFMHAWPFALGFVLATVYLSEPTLGSFYFIMIFLGISVANFFHSWFRYEERMSESNELFELLIYANQNFKVEKERMRLINQNLEDMITKVDKKLEKLKVKKKKVDPKFS